GEYVDKLEKESKMYGDIVILNITENMDQGKTMDYFNWFAKHRNDNYVVKLDDDSFIHLIHYYRDLQDLPRERAYYGNSLICDDRVFMGDIVGSHWNRSEIEGGEDRQVAYWICEVAKKKKYIVHYVGFGDFYPIRENPIHNFDENLDLHSPAETIIIHRLKKIEKLKAIKDLYSEYDEYEEGLPRVRVIRNSMAAGLRTKEEKFQGCWTQLEQNKTLSQMLSQNLHITYKNWFYEAWGFKERSVSVDY
ncbi:7184_t:CDS:2, partial [Diversispora eburnea]